MTFCCCPTNLYLFDFSNVGTLHLYNELIPLYFWKRSLIYCPVPLPASHSQNSRPPTIQELEGLNYSYRTFTSSFKPLYFEYTLPIFSDFEFIESVAGAVSIAGFEEARALCQDFCSHRTTGAAYDFRPYTFDTGVTDSKIADLLRITSNGITVQQYL